MVTEKNKELIKRVCVERSHTLQLIRKGFLFVLMFQYFQESLGFAVRLRKDAGAKWLKCRNCLELR